MHVPFDLRTPRATQRLILRPLGPDDARDVLHYRSRVDVNRYLESEPMRPDEAAAWVTERSDATRIAEDGDRILLGLEADGRVVGDVSLRCDRLVDAQAEIGWVVDPAHQGQGYAREAAAEVLRIAFLELGAHRVFAQLDPRNERSARLCAALGMELEAHLRESSWFKGEWGDLLVYAVRSGS